MLFPRTESEIKEDWLKDVVESYERKSQPEVCATITEFHTKKATKPGDNFNSDLISVELKAEIQNEGKEVQNKEYKLILKFHSLDVFAKEMNRVHNNHIKELQVYSEIKNKIMDFQENENYSKVYKLNIPEFYYGYNKGEDYVIAIKNLKPLGYVMNDKHIGLNFLQLKLAVNQAARWHALTYMYHMKFDILKQFPYLSSGHKSWNLFSGFIEIILKNIFPLITDKEEFRQFFKRICNWKKVKEKFENNMKISDETLGMRSLVHGDYWNNNLLFQYANDEDERDIPKDISVVDWQMCHWNRSIVDLHYLFSTSSTYETRKECLEELLQEYYSVVEEITTTYKSPILGMTYASFKQEFMDSSIVGFIFGLCLSQGTLSKAGETINRPSPGHAVNVRSFGYVLKTMVAKFIAPLTTKSSMKFLMSAMMTKMFEPIGKEILEGSNLSMNSRLLGLLQEAMELGTLDDIEPIE